MDIKELKSKLWITAKQFGNNLDFDVHRHLVLGLVFFKYIANTKSVAKNESNIAVTNRAKQEEQLIFNEFFVPQKSQWHFLQANARQSNIGILLDNAIGSIEKLNKDLENILPTGYSNSRIDQLILGELVSLIGEIDAGRKGDEKELLAEVYEYLTQMFAEFGCRRKGFVYTPQSVAQLMVELTAPYSGQLYDSCCGVGSMFVQSENFIKKRGKTNTLSFFGVERNNITLKIAKMNLALHGIEANLQADDVFANDAHSADYILTSVPLNLPEFKEELLQDDKRWKDAVPLKENASYAWLQHFIYKLSPTGIAGIVLTENSSKRNTDEEVQVRKSFIEDRLVDFIVALPPKLFCTSKGSVCLWILSKNKTNNRYRNVENEILFIDARKLGVMSRRKKELSDEDIVLISRTYHRWKNINGDYIDIKDFCKATTLEEVRKKKYSLFPPTYVKRRVNSKLLPIALLIILIGFFYFIVSKNSLVTSTSKEKDTVVVVKHPIEIESSPAEKISNKTTKRDAKGRAKTKNDTTIVIDEQSQIDQPAEKSVPVAVKKAPARTKYKVISTAYFYNKPNERTRRRAFITHWNNSYANIQGLDEKNGFIYVVFTNHLNQTSKGWLRKKDLKEAEQ